MNMYNPVNTVNPALGLTLRTTGFVMTLIQVLVVLLLLARIIVRCRVFKTAGRHWATALIPFYNTYAMGDIAYGDRGMALIHMVIGALLLNISGFGPLLYFAYSICVFDVTLCKAFGVEDGFDYVALAIPVFRIVQLWNLCEKHQYTGAKTTYIHRLLKITPINRFMKREFDNSTQTAE